MTAYHFAIVHGDRLKGHGLVAPAAHYASIAWRGAERLARVFVARPVWGEIEADLEGGWHLGMVPADSSVGRAFGLSMPNRRGYTVQLVTSPAIRADPGPATTAALDSYLKRQPFI